MIRAVADTGPLLHLHEAGAAFLLPSLFMVICPPGVANELAAHAPGVCEEAVTAGDW